MRFGSLFFSVIHLFFSVLLIALGVFILILAFADQFRMTFINFFQNNDVSIVLVGGIVVLLGLFLMILLFFAYRKHMFVITMGEKAQVSIDEKAVQKYVAEYWKELFPKVDVQSTLYIYRNQIYINVDVPVIKDRDYAHLLEEIEAHLTAIFEKYFHYHDKFHLNISFQT